MHLWCLEDDDPCANPLIFDEGSAGIRSLDFHATLPMLVSHSEGGEIRLWNYDLDSAIQDARFLAGRKLSANEREALELLPE
ncbi:MAG: hypothetical protein KDB03_09560 [Planctomycetales bacterium]|nr:hypothetical protein [Planctomycetales bacterium]